MRSYAVLAVLCATFVVGYCATLPFNFQQVPEQLKDIVPDEVRNFYKDLTDEDKSVLKEIAANHASYENEDQALEALKAKSEKLYTKASELRTLLRTKINALKSDAKSFVENLISKVRALKPKGEEKPDLKKIREVANEVITQYKGLNEESKANLQETFPQITNVLKNEKFQSIAQGLIKEKEAN